MGNALSGRDPPGPVGADGKVLEGRMEAEPSTQQLRQALVFPARRYRRFLEIPAKIPPRKARCPGIRRDVAGYFA